MVGIVPIIVWLAVRLVYYDITAKLILILVLDSSHNSGDRVWMRPIYIHGADLGDQTLVTKGEALQRDSEPGA